MINQITNFKIHFITLQQLKFGKEIIVKMRPFYYPKNNNPQRKSDTQKQIEK